MARLRGLRTSLRRGVTPRVIGLIALCTVAVCALTLTPSFSASFLTKFRAKNLFYTKSQSDSRYLTPSQGDSRYLTPTQGDSRYLTPSQGDSRYLTPTQGDSRYLPASGEIRVNASPLTWRKITAAVTIGENPSTGSTSFGGSTSAIADLPVAIEPTLPTVLVGKPLTFVGVNVCYSTDPITTIDVALVNLTTNTNGAANTSALLTDNTDRGPSEHACRDYTLPTPHALAPGDDVSFQFDVNYSANAGFFSAGRATFIFRL
jgi:hypothetical protein